MTTTTTTYVRYLLPGVFMPEEAVREVGDRDPQRAAREAPENAFAFTFYDVVITTAEIGGKTLTLRSDPLNATGRYYIDPEVLNAADVEALPGDHRILLTNMRGNHWTTILRCRTGNFQPLEDGDTIIDTKRGTL